MKMPLISEYYDGFKTREEPILLEILQGKSRAVMSLKNPKIVDRSECEPQAYFDDTIPVGSGDIAKISVSGELRISWISIVKIASWIGKDIHVAPAEDIQHINIGT